MPLMCMNGDLVEVGDTIQFSGQPRGYVITSIKEESPNVYWLGWVGALSVYKYSDTGKFISWTSNAYHLEYNDSLKDRVKRPNITSGLKRLNEIVSCQ